MGLGARSQHSYFITIILIAWPWTATGRISAGRVCISVKSGTFNPGGYPMSSDTGLGSYLRYGRTLVESGVTGLRSGRESHLHGQPLSEALSDSARASLRMAAVGACAGLLQLYLTRRRGTIPRTVTSGAIGGAIGFCLGFTWRNRELTANMARSALRQVGVVRDQHWLQRHPIDYA